MPRVMVWHGVVGAVPQVGVLAPAPDTKMPRATSPSMPSQLASTYSPSAGSSGNGGAHMPQPLAPPHVRTPVHRVSNGAGVRIMQASVSPASSAPQSHQPLSGTHWR